MKFSSLVLALFTLTIVRSEVFIVDQASKKAGERDGSLSSPYAIIQDCVNRLKSGQPGDECHIRAGRYYEDITISGLHGTKDAPFVIAGYGDERPIIDGTVVIKPLMTWKPVAKGSKIYRTKISSDIWQLFVDGEMMTNARWPNSRWSDYSIFNGSYWGKLKGISKKGLMVNRDNSLADTNINMTGAIAILNIGSFNTYVAKVQNHGAGQNQFTYNDTFGSYVFKPSISKYFLEDKFELLDTAEEWFYDKSTKLLYAWMPKGDNPKRHELRGKVQTYSMTITDTSFLVLKNLEFFATTITATSSKWVNVGSIRFDSIDFNFPSYSKRMLGDISLIEKMRVYGRSKKAYGTFTFYNNTFYGTDGYVIDVNGRNVTFKNNHFAYNDWTGANMITKSGGRGPITSGSVYDTYIRNTFKYNGASTGLRPGNRPVVYLNHIIGQCQGVLQNDGSGVQVTIGSQVLAQVSYNWVHSSPKYGLRFDGQPPRIGRNGTMSHNVVYSTNGLMVKGENHHIMNNLAFRKYNAQDDDKQGSGCRLCVLKYVRTNPVEINKNSVVENNLADRANGGKNKKQGGYWPIAGRVVTNNLFGVNISQVLMDPKNFDFRPVNGSSVAKQNVGPYKYEAKMKYYWIPGRQEYKASTSVPIDGSVTVKASRRDTLMWLQALGCQQHMVYFGTNKEKVKMADGASEEYMDTVNDGGNVYYLPTNVSTGSTYHWRVDAKTDDGIVYKGDVWSFTTK